MPSRIWHSAVIGAVLSVASEQAAPAQAASPYDLRQLPVFHGKVAQYDLDRSGRVDGLILEGGTEVHTASHLAAQLVAVVKPGDAVTIYGIRARVIDLVQAMSVSNDASAAAVVDAGIDSDAAWDGDDGSAGKIQADAQGTITSQLHDAGGNLDGVLLADRTVVHLPPRAAARLAAQLAPGQKLFARGIGRTSLLGRVVDAREVGPSRDRTAPLRGGL